VSAGGTEPLGERELAALAGALSVVLPSSSGDGAREADAIEYVRRRLDREDPELLAALRLRLRTDGADPAALVANLADVPSGSPDDRLFRRIRAWAWEGFLCDPSHGGNRDRVGWRRFGVAGPPQPRGFTPEELAIVRETAT
jgi:gluconate 2-dehydrogenase gamma chain